MALRECVAVRLIRRYWPRHRDKVIYLVVGAWNTLFAYGFFSLLYYLLHQHVPSSGILAIAYAVSSIMGFYTMRHLVFAPVKHPLIEYLRYQVVYLPLVVLNLVVLPLALRYSSLNAYAIQALFAAFAVVASYLGNKYFTFRKPDHAERRTARALQETAVSPRTSDHMLKISVITPSFNHARFLPRTLDSVRLQRAEGEGRFELEHVVVDGGSTDGTVELLQVRTPEVTWVSEPDRGQADALNKGLAMATGDIIGWLNSDDVYEPGALAAVAEVMSAEPATQWVYGRVRIIDERDREIRRWVTCYKDLRMRRFSYNKLLSENWISQMGVFWRRAAGLEVGPFRTELRYCMDYDYWLRLGVRWPGRFIDRRLAAFRWYRGSKSGSSFVEQFGEELEVAKRQAAGGRRWPIFLHRLNSARTVATYHLLRLLGR